MIRKAVIPAAGLGTRFLPATKAVPKELLPVVDKPVIQYVVEEAVSAGISNICIVISPGKEAIEKHFARDHRLEAALAAAGGHRLLAGIRRVSEMARFTFVFQAEQKGLGDAIYCGKDFAGGEAFAVLLGDTIVQSDGPAVGQLAAIHEKYGCGVVLCERVMQADVSRYGIVDAERVGQDLYRLRDMVEKPSPQDAPPSLAVAARYVFTPAIFRCLEETRPGKAGEIQIPDAIRLLIRTEPFYALRLRGRRFDIGEPGGFIRANAVLGRRRSAP